LPRTIHPRGVQQAVDEAAAVELEFDVLRPDDLQPRRGAAVGIVAPYWALPRPQDVIATGKRRPAFVVDIDTAGRYPLLSPLENEQDDRPKTNGPSGSLNSTPA
jgi:hypothetical protein